MPKRLFTGYAMALLVSLAGSAAFAAEGISLTIKDHRFLPVQVTAPAGERIRIEVANLDSSPEEFESSDLRVEKIIVPSGKIVLMVGPLKPGSYKFFGDYHPETAAGTLTVLE